MEIISISIGMIIGIISGQYLNISIALILSIILFIIGVFIMTKYKQYIKICILFIISIIIMFGIVKVSNLYENENLVLTKEKFIVTSDKQEKQYTNLYTIKSKNGEKYLLYTAKKNNIEYSDEIIINGEIEEAEEDHNYGGFNYNLYLKTKGINGIIYADNVEIRNKGKPDFIYSIRKSIKDKIKKLLDDETGNLLISLLIGDKTDLSDNIKENFKNSNLSHMLAISGAHVSFIITGITMLLSKLKTRKRKIKISIIIFLSFFMILTGGAPSIQRACIMGIYQLMGSLLYKRTNSYVALSFSLIIILFENPFNLFDIGLQLSFLGTLGILIFNKSNFDKKVKNRFIKYILTSAIVSISANIMIIPIILVNYNTLNLSFLVSNVLASPLLEISILLGISILLISYIFEPIAIPLSFILNIILNLLIKIAEISSKLPFSKLYIITPNIIEITLYYLFICTSKYVKKWKKIISILIILIFIFEFLISIVPKNLRIYFVNVGQGDCTLICTKYNKKILIDGGGDENYDVGEKILFPYLLDRRITSIDYLIPSHFDSDHVRGLITIAKNMDVKYLVVTKQGENSKNYEELIDIARKKKIKVILVGKGTILNFDKETKFEIYHPDNKHLINENTLNNNSIVGRLVYHKFSMLFTGDIEKIAEEQIYKDIPNSTILKIAHHGSSTSSSDEFLNKVNPQIALIGVGKKNKFKHPSDSTIEKLKKRNVKIYRTDQDGEIEILVNSNLQLKIVAKTRKE